MGHPVQRLRAAPLHHFDGSAWSVVELEDPVESLPSDAELIGAPEGVIVHSDSLTQQYRWGCPISAG
ncbi:hypothetical protein ENSA5_56380 [Enhygromyxa salina]|uniref:Uncharacterized protein n=1 Tax=Enhygromyxa salina TaxID=215803 RepID=A0A2S9XEJ5_9BACT|nr:hypothetical protein ENSA5_56380 [Enhygromyxa salina]